MIPTLTYLQFHLVFTLPLVAALWYLTPEYDRVRRRRATVGITVLVAIAYAYTTPWISYMIRRGAWSYGEGAVFVRALSIPLGEYLFFGIQTVIAGFVLHRIGFDPAFREGDFDRRPRVAGVLVGLSMVAGGLWLVSLDDAFLYLGGLIAWVGPVLALQWSVGGGYLARTPRVWLTVTLVPAVYFWIVDRIAIGMGTWVLSTELTTGVAVLGLPIEEMLFFASANLMTVNGLVLFEWVLDWNDRRTAVEGSIATVPDDVGPGND
ncbi:lycopene cyclase domain-containing protein [Halorubrum sp. 48-1-W]|uniref:lycopene cyclase domain-containing protein n=1 Tax=Halorubrum sp. 48-1-W TaxID=2249761 RepID=UPI000DCD4F6A|nr:lycopene cyclase domain-containing protein [Halorubrum sp. 48-1-W]RAW45038.1 lycopene cyclase domain-containing protein [Halorubrum sp. 48-1-W]